MTKKLLDNNSRNKKHKKRKKIPMIRMMMRTATPVQRSSSGRPRMRSGLQELDTVTLTKSVIEMSDHDQGNLSSSHLRRAWWLVWPCTATGPDVSRPRSPA